MAKRQPPTIGVALAWIGGSFMALIALVVGMFFFLVLVTTVASAPANLGRPSSSPPSFVRQFPDRPVEPNYNPPPQPAYVPPPSPPVVNPEPAPQPPVIPPHLSFADLDDALKYLQSDKEIEKRAAMTYIEKASPAAAGHDKVMAAARVLLNEEAYRSSAMNILKRWAVKEDVPLLRELLGNMVQTNLAQNAGGPPLVSAVIGLLSGFGDAESASQFAQCLRTESVRDSASAALVKLGPDAENAFAPLALDDDAATSKEALKLLAAVGTPRSALMFHRAIYLKSPEIAAAAEAQLKVFAERLNLKPEQYLYTVLDRYALDPPANFKADTKFSKPNARQWTRTAPNRSVVSSFTIFVRVVPKGFQVNPVSNDSPTEVGPLTFHRVDDPVFDNQRRSQTEHFAAVDGEFCIDLVLTLDQTDTPAANSITTAVRSIRPKLQ